MRTQYFSTAFSVSFCIIVLLLLSSCQSRFDNIETYRYRLIAWNSLSEQEQKTVKHDIDDAIVNEDAEFRDWTKEQNTTPVPAISVRFNTDDDALLGPIVVYLDPETEEVLGQAPRF